MGEQKKCLRCGSTNVTPSELQSTGKIYSRPKNSKLVAILTTGAPVEALMCLDCGHVEMLVSVGKAKELVKSV